MPDRPRRWTAVYIAMAGLAFATFNAWRLHDRALATAGVVILVVLALVGLYAGRRS